MAQMIRTRPGLWVFNPTNAQIKKTLERPPHFISEDADDNGERIYLVNERSVLCPDKSISGYPTSKGKHWRPVQECRKCKFQNNPRGRSHLGCTYNGAP